jgi:nicotinate-nucleotide adenylyltransferase
MRTNTKNQSTAALNSWRIGIYGGSFDPIHNGHLRAARAARASLQLDEVIFVPTGIPPHKGAGHSAAPLHRYAMASLAIAEEQGFRVSDIEVRDETPSYSVDTVGRLIDAQPLATEWYFIFGDDCAANLHRWKGLDELLRRVHFISVPRHGLHAQIQLQQSVSTLEISPYHANSSDIRQALANGMTRGLPLAPPVISYIIEQGLYGCPGPNQRNQDG